MLQKQKTTEMTIDNYIKVLNALINMQKRGLFFLAVMLSIVFLPMADAEISINGPGKSAANIGDEIVMNGHLMRDADTIGTFKLVLSCTTEQQLLAKSISLKANVKKDFSENLVIPEYLEGDCVIKALLDQAGKIIDQASSPTFTISRDLSGSFKIDKEKIKRGDSLTIDAAITKLDGTQFNGIATLHFKQGGTDVFVDTVQINKGKFVYKYNTKENPSGQYIVDAVVQDVYGNAKIFQAGTFLILGDMLIFAEPDKLHYMPGDDAKVSGEATILDRPVDDANVKLKLDENTAETDVSKGKFSKSIQVPYTITSGTHVVDVSIEDEFGNRGNVQVSIIVDPAPTKLDFAKEKESYLPGEVIKIVPVLLDQAGNVIDTEIGVIISNPKGKETFTDTIKSNSEYEFHLADSALPGAWNIHLFAMEKEHDGTIMIGEKTVIDYVILNQTLYITNSGNVRFSSPVKVEYKSLDKIFTFVKEFTIGTNETAAVDLAKGVEPGVYDIYVADKVFEDVAITKSGWPADKIITFLLGLIALVLIILLIRYILGWKRHGRRAVNRNFKDKRHDDKRIVFAHKPRDEREHVHLFRQKMKTHVETQKPKLRLRIKKSKEPDEFVYEIPKKKEHPITPKRENRDYDPYSFGNEPDEWREQKNTYKDEPKYSYVESSSYEEKEDIAKKKKGLFNMFD